MVAIQRSEDEHRPDLGATVGRQSDELFLGRGRNRGALPADQRGYVDRGGAEGDPVRAHLLGLGDDPSGVQKRLGGDAADVETDAAKPVRVQGCYIGERETEELVKYLRDQEEPNYTMIPSEAGDSDGGGDFEDDGSSDDLFEPCVRWLVMQGQCSTSSLQRKFKIGYTRAARLVETMEARGLVGPQDGVKPREILLQKENVDVFFAGHQDGDLGQ